VVVGGLGHQYSETLRSYTLVLHIPTRHTVQLSEIPIAGNFKKAQFFRMSSMSYMSLVFTAHFAAHRQYVCTVQIEVIHLKRLFLNLLLDYGSSIFPASFILYFCKDDVGDN
jgi:hypothetical protein